MGIPPPEMQLFKHGMPINAFYETVLGAKRWGGKEALAAAVASNPFWAGWAPSMLEFVKSIGFDQLEEALYTCMTKE